MPAVEHTVRLLNHLSHHGGGTGCSLTELCEGAGVPLSSGLNILRTLEANDYVRFEPDSKRYKLGWTLVAGIGLRASRGMGFPEILHTYLVRLEQQTQLTTLLIQLVGESALVVDKVEGSRDIRASASVGHLSPVSAGAPGKAILAFQDEERVLDYISRVGLPAYTALAITDEQAFLAELASVRETGYARSIEEYAGGVNAVAAPVFDAAGRANLAVSVLGLTSFLPTGRAHEFGALVVAAGRQMTMAIGGTWPAGIPAHDAGATRPSTAPAGSPLPR